MLLRSTLEQFRAPMFENNHSDPEGWSLGKLDNIREVRKVVLLWRKSSRISLDITVSFASQLLDFAGDGSQRLAVVCASENSPG